MSIRSSISHVPQQQICSRLDHVLRIGTEAVPPLAQISSVNLLHPAPIEGSLKRISILLDKEYQKNKKDYERNKKEFPAQIAIAFFQYAEAIRNLEFTWVREGLSSIYHKVSPDDYLLDQKLYFRGELSSLVDVAKKYFENETNDDMRQRRERMYYRIVSYEREYAKRKRKAAMEKEMD